MVQQTNKGSNMGNGYSMKQLLRRKPANVQITQEECLMNVHHLQQLQSANLLLQLVPTPASQLVQQFLQVVPTPQPHLALYRLHIVDLIIIIRLLLQ